MTVLRENARISKDKLNKLIKGIRGGLYLEETKTVCSCCSSCPYKDKLGLFKEYCEEYCDKKETVIEVKKFNTIKKIKNISVEGTGEPVHTLELEYVVKDHKFIQPSKSVIKQYIFYHFLVANQYRVRTNITAKFVSQELNVSVATVKRNNQLLQDLGLIHIRRIDPSTFDIYIYEEDKLHLKKSEGGTGYLPLSKELYERIKQIKDVNVLRIELKKILKADADKNLKREVTANVSQVRANSIIEILPYYLRRAKKKLNEKIFSDQSIFELKVSGEGSYQMDITKYKTSEMFVQEFMNNTKTSLIEFVRENNISILPENEELLEAPEENVSPEQYRESLYDEKITDLAQLCLEYGVQTILDILIYIKHRYIEKENISINNIGAFVRTIIRYFISLEGSTFTIAG